jgi:hypothetical protein
MLTGDAYPAAFGIHLLCRFWSLEVRDLVVLPTVRGLEVLPGGSLHSNVAIRVSMHVQCPTTIAQIDTALC